MAPPELPGSPVPPGRRLLLLLAVAAVFLIAVNLRPGATSIGPVLAEVRRDLGMSGAVAGALTALPGLCFAAFGALTVPLARRTGTGWAITLGALAIAAGLLARAVVTSVPAFFALTVLAFAGMAVGNILVPAFVKERFAARMAAMMTLYTVGLAVGSTTPTLLAGPILAVVPNGWRSALGIWGVTGAVAFVLWAVLVLLVRRGRRGAPPPPPARRPGGTLLRSRTAVALTLFFGLQSAQAYVLFGWLPQIYRDGGLSQAAAGVMAGIAAAMGIPGGLTMPRIAARSQDLRPLMAGFGAALAAGYLGLLLAPATLPWLWAVLLGLAGFAFPTALALIAVRSRDPRVTARLSGFSQSIGYVLAASGPFLVGFLRDATDGWTVPLLVLAASGAALTAAGWVIARPRFVDDEIGAGPARTARP